MLLEDRIEIRVPRETAPVLSVVIDTEEEFDWSARFDRQATAVTALRAVGRVQRLFNEFAVRPTYVVDYPVAAQAEGCAAIKAFVDAGAAEIGAHLHPWVSPPHDEDVCAHNSYPGNLDADLEARKLHALSDRIAAAFGRPPVIYKAGRWGFGPHTAAILERQGFEVDLSVSPPFDYSADGGPDYAGFSAHPYWFGARRPLLGLPLTGSFVGLLRHHGERWYRVVNRDGWRRARVPAILARLRLLDRLALSPEGMTLDELRRLTRALLADGLRTFVLSFHSPSLQPGCTPYVRTDAQLERLYDTLRGYLEFFLGELGGSSRTPLEIKRVLHDLTASPAP